MRRGTVLILTLTVVILLLLSVCFLRKDTSVQHATDAGRDTSVPAYEMMYERPLNSLEKIEVLLSGGESYRLNPCMVFDEAGRLLGVSSVLGQPLTVEGQDGFALDPTAYQMMLLAAQGIPATARYPSLDRGACGLTDPRACITAGYTDGSEIRLYIGNKTASGLSCYVSVDGSDETYLVPYDFYDVMTRPLKAQHRLPGAISHTAADTGQVALDGTSQGRIIVSRQDGEDRLLHWQVTSPVVHDASENAVEQFVRGLCEVHAEQYVDTVYDMDGLSAYSLQKPVRYVAMFSDGTVRDLHIGCDAGDGRVYVRMDTTGDVYLISRSQLDFVRDAGLDMMMDRFVDLVPLNTVNRVVVRSRGDSWVLAQDWPEASGSVASGWTVNGQVTEQRDFSGLYSLLVGLQFDRTAVSAAAPARETMTVTYELRNGGIRELKFCSHDQFYDTVTTSGGASLLVRHTKTEEILRALEAYSLETE